MESNNDAIFSIIDIESWERKEYFLHYYNDVRCIYSVTVNVDITEIYSQVKDRSLRLYPTLIWWIAFTSFNLNVFTTDTHLPPIFTTGKLINENDKVTIPFCLQVHHSICDGYHAGQFFTYLRKLAGEVEQWM